MNLQKTIIFYMLILALIYFFAIPLQAQPRYFNSSGKETENINEAISWETGSLTLVAQPSGISKARFIGISIGEKQFVTLVQRAAAQWESTGMGLKIFIEEDMVGEPSLGNYRLEVGWASTSHILSVNEQRAQRKKLQRELKKRGAGILGACVPCNLPGIVESDVFLNYEYEPGWTEDLLYRVLVHEIGHLLGLAHTPAGKAYCGTSIMYPDPNLLDSANQRSTTSGEAKTCMSFTQHDVKAIRALYHPDKLADFYNPIARASPSNPAPIIITSGTTDEFEKCWKGTKNVESFKRKTKVVFHWLMLGKYTSTHLLERRWYDPNGYLVMQDVGAIRESQQGSGLSDSSINCAALFFDVDINPPIQPIPGRWRIDVYMNGELVYQDNFQIEGKSIVAVPLPSNRNPIPRIVPVELPDVVKEWEGGVWVFHFEDVDRDIDNVLIEFLNSQGEWESKAYADIIGYTARVAGATEGMIYITSGCWKAYAETTSKIVERITIIDRAGHKSEPLQYSYDCVSERSEALEERVNQMRQITKKSSASSDKTQTISIDMFDLQGIAVASNIQIGMLPNQFKLENELKLLIPRSLANGVYIVIITIQRLEGVRRKVYKVVVLR